MNKTEKLLTKLAPRIRKTILLILIQLEAGNETGLDVKPLKGHNQIFRVRIGGYRIIYTRHQGKFHLIAVTKRDDKTYRDF